MPVRKILMGQVWKRNDNGDTFLVTKLYNEVFATYAVLRKIGGEELYRIKLEKSGDMSDLPGFNYKQEAQEF